MSKLIINVLELNIYCISVITDLQPGDSFLVGLLQATQHPRLGIEQGIGIDADGGLRHRRLKLLQGLAVNFESSVDLIILSFFIILEAGVEAVPVGPQSSGEPFLQDGLEMFVDLWPVLHHEEEAFQVAGDIDLADDDEVEWELVPA